jgi:hypothetical protein
LVFYLLYIYIYIYIYIGKDIYKHIKQELQLKSKDNKKKGWAT